MIVNAVISAATISDERAEIVDFSDPYFNAGQMIAVRAADADEIKTPADLDGRKVGGVLTATQSLRQPLTSLTWGIGLNVDQAPAGFVPDLFVPATGCLADFAKSEVAPTVGDFLETILGELEQKKVPIIYSTAVGLAIEKFEAWLLADEPRLCEVLGMPNPAEPLPPPETLPHRGKKDPKRILRSRIEQAGGSHVSFSELARRIVERMDLHVLAERCPEGFGAFRDQVRQKVGPLFGR